MWFSFFSLSFISLGFNSISFLVNFSKSMKWGNILHSFPIAVAVIKLSPVTIITFTWAWWHLITDSETFSLKESLRQNMEINVKFFWSI